MCCFFVIKKPLNRVTSIFSVIPKVFKMKRFLLVFGFLVTVVLNSMAQDEKETASKPSGFFTGGNSVLSFFGGNYAVGVNPTIGYRVASVLDLGVYANYTYLSMPKYSYIYAFHQQLLGAGGFLRFYPAPFLFAQFSAENNTNSNTYISLANRNDQTTSKEKVSSLFAGFGYAHNRLKFANKPFFSLALLWDVTNNPLSPYKDNRSKAFPIVKFGYNLPLTK